jgi:hypothetical protein
VLPSVAPRCSLALASGRPGPRRASPPGARLRASRRELAEFGGDGELFAAKQPARLERQSSRARCSGRRIADAEPRRDPRARRKPGGPESARPAMDTYASASADRCTFQTFA